MPVEQACLERIHIGVIAAHVGKPAWVDEVRRLVPAASRWALGSSIATMVTCTVGGS